MNGTRIQWHPAFCAAFQVELAEYADGLIFESEHQLANKPLQIDVLILKKSAELKIHKKIGNIFKAHNIIEYKSPDQSLSVNDFDRVYGYACIYQSSTEKVLEIQPEEITITFAVYRWPGKVVRHLEKGFKITVEQYADGIYYLKGNVIDIQILIIPELSKKETYWLQALRNNLKFKDELQEFIKRSEENQESGLHQAIAYVVVKANAAAIKKEESDMLQVIREIMEENPEAFPEYANMKAAEEKGRELERINTQRAEEQVRCEKERADRAERELANLKALLISKGITV